MTTNLSNLNTSELRILATGPGTLAECARRLLAQREAEHAALEAANRAALEAEDKRSGEAMVRRLAALMGLPASRQV